MGSSESGRERILEAATRLFSALGYDGTSTRMIAEAAGLNVATVAYHVGGKRDLYLAVMERAHEAERAALEEALGRMTPDVDGLLSLVDAYVGFCLARPEIPALWMHRWLSDASDVVHLEEQYVRPLMQMVTEAVRKVVPDDIDVDYVVWTVVWCTHGFGRGGVLDPGGHRHGADDPQAVDRFRRHMRRTIALAIGAPDRARG
ncbi:transcriptional regulator, TetR family [Actinomadura meyerae]|uniref:Transcriptional regulator, TetR family n=1 Tax=Actinomadura meyerae TaxID=240840 RepID=A0A239HX34_9ACTN|nr:TetR/AcrR family transcriptional regulator [Actinomadura meyerae]SNS85889.1 transcriptional regulator, TetR family [Actinomadura meyerae]